MENNGYQEYDADRTVIPLYVKEESFFHKILPFPIIIAEVKSTALNPLSFLLEDRGRNSQTDV